MASAGMSLSLLKKNVQMPEWEDSNIFFLNVCTLQIMYRANKLHVCRVPYENEFDKKK